MAYLSVPTRRGSMFQNETSAHRLRLQKLAEKTEEYNSRHTRQSANDDQEHVTINVGGEIFMTRRSTLRNVPSTLLARLAEDDEHFPDDMQHYFFDRNPFLFQYILDYYRTGSLHLPRHICSASIKDELKFWGLGDGCIAECCRKYYFDELDEYTTYELIKAEFYNLPTYSPEESSADSSRKKESQFQKFRRQAWVFIDNHESSLMAKIFAVFYYGLVIISILSLFFSTLTSIRVPLKGHLLVRSRVQPPVMNITHNVTETLKLLLSTDPPDLLVVVDLICLVFFTVEFFFRLIVCPSIIRRFQSWYTIVDLLYLIPAWIRFIIDIAAPFFWQTDHNTIMVSVILDALMVLRVLRIFRLSRHYRGLRVLLLAIKASVGELMLLIVFVLFSLTMYACVSYCAEQISGQDTFNSIFIALWWALITMTTVGYGDYYPCSTFGYIVASFCAISGLLIIGMVVPIIAGNFHHYYGFRYAGCDDVELWKPEFVPPENENPFPCSSTFETYKKKMNRLISHRSLNRPPKRSTTVSPKEGSSTMFDHDSATSITNDNRNCIPVETKIASPRATKIHLPTKPDNFI